MLVQKPLDNPQLLPPVSRKVLAAACGGAGRGRGAKAQGSQGLRVSLAVCRHPHIPLKRPQRFHGLAVHPPIQRVDMVAPISQRLLHGPRLIQGICRQVFAIQQGRRCRGAGAKQSTAYGNSQKFANFHNCFSCSCCYHARAASGGQPFQNKEGGGARYIASTGSFEPEPFQLAVSAESYFNPQRDKKYIPRLMHATEQKVLDLYGMAASDQVGTIRLPFMDNFLPDGGPSAKLRPSRPQIKVAVSFLVSLLSLPRHAR